jgi:protein involved in sex pheromone biosynthesis
MKKIVLLSIAFIFILTGCNKATQETKDKKQVQSQQSQYAKSQPIPT